MKSIKELRNELNEFKQEDLIEAKLSPDQRKRLDGLIGDVIDVTDPFYLGLGIPGNNVDLEKTLETIESEFGKEVRDSVENGIDIWHYGRENRADGDDPLDNIFHRRGKGRITKKGKLNKQDAESLKKSIKKNLKSSSLGIQKLKKAVKQNKSRFAESKQEDIADLKALLKNPDPKVAKNYGGIEGYKKMIQSKIDKLMKEETELDERKVTLSDLLRVVKTAKDDWKNIPGLDQEYDSFEDYLDTVKQRVRDFRKKNPSAKSRWLDHLVEEETELDEAKDLEFEKGQVLKLKSAVGGDPYSVKIRKVDDTHIEFVKIDSKGNPVGTRKKLKKSFFPSLVTELEENKHNTPDDKETQQYWMFAVMAPDYITKWNPEKTLLIWKGFGDYSRILKTAEDVLAEYAPYIDLIHLAKAGSNNTPIVMQTLGSVLDAPGTRPELTVKRLSKGMKVVKLPPRNKLKKESTELEEAEADLQESKEEPKVIELARDVLENGAKKVKDPVTGKSHLLDAFSASAIVQIYEKLGAANQKKMVSMPLPKIVSVVFKLVNKSKNESVEELDEALTRAQRIKRSQIAKRNKAKIQRALKKGKKKKASTETLQKRAKKKARDLLYTKLLKGRNRADVSAGEQERIEKKLDKMQGAINRIAKKLLPQLKKAEQEKLKSKSEE